MPVKNAESPKTKKVKLKNLMNLTPTEARILFKTVRKMPSKRKGIPGYNHSWQILGYLDGKATERYNDNCFVRSHKLCVHERPSELLDGEEHYNLYNSICEPYRESSQFVQYVQTPMYGKNTYFTQLAVVALENIEKSRKNGGL